MYILRGKVIRPDSSAVSGAAILLSPGAHDNTTDAAGQFIFSDVPAGSAVISVSHPYSGLRNVTVRLSIPNDTGGLITIVMPELTYELDEVVVISPQAETDISEETPSHVTVIPREEFENKTRTVADAVSATPGAVIQSMGGLGAHSEVSLRGSNANQVQVFLDDMLLNDAVGGVVNLATLPLSNVQSIEVWRSGAPSVFGGDAVGGAINIKTRDSAHTAPIVSLGYGSFNTMNASTVFSIPVDTSPLLVTLDYASSDNDFPFVSDNGTMYNSDDDFSVTRKNNRFRSLNLLARYRRLIGETTMIDISEHILSSKKELPGKDIVQLSRASMGTVKNMFQAKISAIPMGLEWLEYKPHIYHIYSREHYRDKKGRIGWGIQDNLYQSGTIRFLSPLIVTLPQRTGSIHVTPIADHESYRPNHKLQTTLPLAGDREHIAIALDGNFNLPGNRINLTSGIRRDRYFSIFDGQLSPVIPIKPKPKFNHMTNWHSGVRVSLVQNLSVRGNYGVMSRVPGFYELFGDRGYTYSNPNLKSERTRRWDAGVKLRQRSNALSSDFSLEIVYFENSYDDLIQWYATDAGFIYPDNVGKANVKGTEVIWNSNVGGLLILSGNWTFQQSRVTEEKRAYYINKMLPNRPDNYGTVTIESSIGWINSFWTINRKGSYFLDRANQSHKRYPGRTIHNAGVTGTIANGRFKLSLLVQNVTDKQTFDTEGLPLPGRSYTITVTHNFNQ